VDEKLAGETDGLESGKYFIGLASQPSIKKILVLTFRQSLTLSFGFIVSISPTNVFSYNLLY
jgi:hypothetical protein